jgi:hypothetical protein
VIDLTAIDLRRGITRELLILDAALVAEPNLTTNGFESDRVGGFIDRKLELYERLDQIAACAAWLSRRSETKAINRRRTSYGWKHAVEAEAGRYIANGAFLAAAIGLGWRYEKCAGGLNALLPISQRGRSLRPSLYPRPSPSVF